eukprot:SAG22_NODE_1243_length_5022_cov_3.983953_3_plen_75_part_00
MTVLALALALALASAAAVTTATSKAAGLLPYPASQYPTGKHPVDPTIFVVCASVLLPSMSVRSWLHVPLLLHAV